MVQTVFGKGTGIITQVALAWLLLPEHFGLVGLALTVSAFVGLLMQAGIREVLIHRYRRYALWVTPAFWMSLAIGLATAGLMLLAGPLAVRLYGEPALAGLLAVLAIGSPLSAAVAIPTAALQAELRFRFLARLTMLEAVGKMVLSILFAWLGFGAYSFVLPLPILSAARLVIEWRAVRPPVGRHPQFRRWKYLLRDSGALLLGGFVIAIIAQGDYIILGAMFSAAVVGIYFFAFGLSMQAVSMLSAQVSTVLFPALAKIDDPIRQTRIYLDSLRLFALVTTPVAAIQILAADPLIRLFFAERWYGAITLIQILSIAVGFRLVAATGVALLQAQGRFVYRLILFSIYAPIFSCMVIIGAQAGGAEGVACAVTAYYFLLAIVHIWLVTRKHLPSFWLAMGIYRKAAPLTIIAGLLGWWAMRQAGLQMVEDSTVWLVRPPAFARFADIPAHLIALVAGVGTCGLAYLVGVCLFAGKEVAELRARFGLKKKG